ncbi:hypothetical protein Tco_1541405 [Tanacetum coccineum]
MGTPTQVCVRSCANISAPAGRPFRCVKSKNTCNNDKNLSKIQLEHENEDELVVVVVKVVHELDCMMVVKEIEDGLLEEMEKFGWWFEQDIGGESEDDREKRLMMRVGLSGYGVLVFSFVVFGEMQARIRRIFLMDTAYRLSETESSNVFV